MNVFSNPVANLDMTESVEIDSKQNCVKAGDVFFTTSSETPEEVGMSSVMPENADRPCLGSGTLRHERNQSLQTQHQQYLRGAGTFLPLPIRQSQNHCHGDG